MLGRGRLSRTHLQSLSHEELLELLCSADQMLSSASPHTHISTASTHTHTQPALPTPSAPVEAEAADPDRQRKRRTDASRPFDMSRYGQRWVAMRVAYVGTRYCGMQYCEGVETVEGALFDALMKTRLICSKDECGFSRGGRTDRGVSALGQVVALRLRSSVVPPPATVTAVSAAQGHSASSGLADVAAGASSYGNEQGSVDSSSAMLPETEGEMDYAHVLNRVLPPDVRVISWAPTTPNWSARFAARSRTYHYFFARGRLDVGAMRDGASRFIGTHDFRNFCKVDVNVTSFTRHIFSFDIEPVEDLHIMTGIHPGQGEGPPNGTSTDAESPFSPWVFKIRGSAFLWHQVRCMVATLFLIGSGREDPTLIDALLDIEAHPARPTYDMAPDAPLLLHSIEYADLRWTPHQPTVLAALSAGWAREAEAASLRTAILHTMRCSLFEAEVKSAENGHGATSMAVEDGGEPPLITWRASLRSSGQDAPLGEGDARGGKYVPVLQRSTADSVEERAASHKAKKARKDARADDGVPSSR